MQFRQIQTRFGRFLVQIDVPGKPRRSREVPGSISGVKHRKTGPKIFSQTAIRHPVPRNGPADGSRGPVSWLLAPQAGQLTGPADPSAGSWPGSGPLSLLTSHVRPTGSGPPRPAYRLWTSLSGLPALDHFVRPTGSGPLRPAYRLWTLSGLPALDSLLYPIGEETSSGLPALDL